jgi:cyclophilin family peptidyl-prolyl cis-trans isomerase
MRIQLAALLACLCVTVAGAADRISAHPRVVLETSMGTIKLELETKQAPLTVAHFLELVEAGYYDGLVFHRVIPDFMIQGGDPTGTGTGGPGYQFGDETSPDVKMAPGVLAMANAGPGTNGSQFFITEGSPSYLDGKHTIFGTCKPLEVVGKIARVKRDGGDRPTTPVKMKITISRGSL